MKLFDAHLHIIDFNFPVHENQGYLPPPYTVADYKNETKTLNIQGGAIVSGSFQGFDQDYLLQALNKLGSSFCGVTQLPADVTDTQIKNLNKKGVSALRFNVKRGGSEDLAHLDYLARRVYELVGWHSELYIDARQLPEISDVIVKLPAISIDHLGLSEAGLPHLLKLVDQGVRVKATGFGRIDLDVQNATQQIYQVNPEALMFGTDLPSTRAKRRFNNSDLRRLENVFSDQALEKICYQNAYDWYFGKGDQDV